MSCPVRNDTRAQMGVPIAPESMTSRACGSRFRKRVFSCTMNGTPAARHALDDGYATLPGRSKRLLHDTGSLWLAASPTSCVRFHRGRDVDEVELLARSISAASRSKLPAPVALRSVARLLGIDIADGRELDAVHARPGGQMVLGEEPAADDPDPKR